MNTTTAPATRATIDAESDLLTLREAACSAPKRDYAAFLASKQIAAPSTGFVGVSTSDLSPLLFDHQKAVTAWALHKGRAAIFADTGLGKTYDELEWARQVALLTNGSVLIVAPFGVAFVQMPDMAAAMGISLTVCRSQSDVRPGSVNVTNYEKLHLFDMGHFAGVVLDESSILKNFEGATRNLLVSSCRCVPYRLCATATPSPNDITEIANHAEFLGVMTRAEMLAAFFTNDDNGWRLKGWAVDAFYAWLASWSVWVGKPSDIGFSDAGYNLPALHIHPIIVETDYAPEGSLMAVGVKGVTDRARVRKETVAERVHAAIKQINAEPAEPWVVWAGLNAEADSITAALPGSVNVQGSMEAESKANALHDFAHGQIQRIVTKPSICAQGMNWQHCARTIFVGLSDSYEDYYQCLRRFYRFRQLREVHAWIVLAEPQSPIYENILRKEREWAATRREMVSRMAEFRDSSLAPTTTGGGVKTDRATGAEAFTPTQTLTIPAWLRPSPIAAPAPAAARN